MSSKKSDPQQPGPSDTNTSSRKCKKWTSLKHNGPCFPPPYKQLPDEVNFYYDGKKFKLSRDAEEVAGFYSKMLKIRKDTMFERNFLHDWQKSMTKKEKQLITDLSKCNFNELYHYYLNKNKIWTNEENKMLKAREKDKYGVCEIDGNIECINNYKIEPPGIFRGRGKHPKSGKLKKRIRPEDIIINCSKDCEIPAPVNTNWKKIQHDDTVTWLACWTDQLQKRKKYIMLSSCSKLECEFDRNKYETVRKLKDCMEDIRQNISLEWNSQDLAIRQRAVALHFIDKLAMRPGNDKNITEQADTVGCCSLRCEHIRLQKKNRRYFVLFDFQSKGSIPYRKKVPVEKIVFDNLMSFKVNKKNSDKLFDKVNPRILNRYLKEYSPDLTAKVFRTYNASMLLQQKLDEFTTISDDIKEKIISFQKAIKFSAILCNHLRSIPNRNFSNYGNVYSNTENNLNANSDHSSNTVNSISSYNIAPETTKEHYVDPRIIVAWCKKHDVPIERIYKNSLLKKFKWAIDELAENDDWKY